MYICIYIYIYICIYTYGCMQVMSFHEAIEEDEYPLLDEMDLREWYHIGMPVKGVLWRQQVCAHVCVCRCVCVCVCAFK